MPGRYTYAPPINSGEGKSNPRISSKIYKGVISGAIPFRAQRLKQAQRLDHLAAEFYGSASYWWIIAAASGIGWNMQVPAGTIIRIPRNLGQILTIR
tara:strand:+ start:303 stop:593 length:291 start_codon:yes stop_codon:yes gene_type:complete